MADCGPRTAERPPAPGEREMARAGSAPGTPRYRLKGLIGAAAPSLYSMPLSACPSSVTEDVRPGESAPPPTAGGVGEDRWHPQCRLLPGVAGRHLRRRKRSGRCCRLPGWQKKGGSLRVRPQMRIRGRPIGQGGAPGREVWAAALPLPTL